VQVLPTHSGAVPCGHIPVHLDHTFLLMLNQCHFKTLHQCLRTLGHSEAGILHLISEETAQQGPVNFPEFKEATRGLISLEPRLLPEPASASPHYPCFMFEVCTCPRCGDRVGLGWTVISKGSHRHLLQPVQRQP
jgi:hypothetical protein